MIELSKPIIAENGTLVPAGVRLEFKNGIASYQSAKLRRALIPLDAIKGGRNIFVNAVSATILNDVRDFQEKYKRKYENWAHLITYADHIIVYIWDTREVIDVIPGLQNEVRGGKKIRTLVNTKTGERIVKNLGSNQFGWGKKLFDMMEWPKYQRPDNGMPLICKNKEWQETINAFNSKVVAFESIAKLDQGLKAKDIARYRKLGNFFDITEADGQIILHVKTNDEFDYKLYIAKNGALTLSQQFSQNVKIAPTWNTVKSGMQTVEEALDLLIKRYNKGVSYSPKRKTIE